MTHFAEQYATPISGQLANNSPRRNDFQELFYIRWGRIHFQVHRGLDVNIKVVLKVYRGDVCEHYIVDTDPYDIHWNQHKRKTRDFYIHPFPQNLSGVTSVKFGYLVHFQEHSIPSEQEYIFMDGHEFLGDESQQRTITSKHATPNWYRTHELDAGILQRDVDHYNHNFDSLQLVPKFTKGQPNHPFHPKQYIHDQIDAVVARKHADAGSEHTIKLSVDCIDDTDFTNHLLHAHSQGVRVQCLVDWRKMMLTNSANYARLKQAGLELVGVFCTPKDPIIEVAPDMHTKFIIFDDRDVITGSFNITFDRWGSNWESGMTFHSQGIARLFENIFQSIRGGVNQPYGIDPLSHFNLLYTFGRHRALSGKFYRPHQAIISEIRRANDSIKLCLFLMGEMVGDHHDSVVDALLAARHRGVHVEIILNGHLARQGDPGAEVPMDVEVQRPLLPAVQRLKDGGVNVMLAYGQVDQPVPYCPIHAKYCIIDHHIVLDGSFNWYNTSVFSHDTLVVANNHHIAKPYLHEFDQIQQQFRIYR